MLVEFEVGNYRSFKDPVRLSMVAANPINKEFLEEKQPFRPGGIACSKVRLSMGKR